MAPGRGAAGIDSISHSRGPDDVQVSDRASRAWRGPFTMALLWVEWWRLCAEDLERAASTGRVDLSRGRRDRGKSISPYEAWMRTELLGVAELGSGERPQQERKGESRSAGKELRGAGSVR